MGRDLVLAMANVGSEVNRAIRCKKAGKIEMQNNFLDKAFSILNETKNTLAKPQQNELDLCKKELEDFFGIPNGDKIKFNSSETTIMRYYDQFMYALK